jgi:hypothetical protein
MIEENKSIFGTELKDIELTEVDEFNKAKLDAFKTARSNKKHERQTSVPVGKITYFAKKKDLVNYKNTYDLAVLKELDTVGISVEEGNISVGIDDLKAGIIAIGEQHYTVFFKYKTIFISIKNAKDINELNSLVLK